MVSSCPSLVPIQTPDVPVRTRTDPTLKWLLNERAALAGAQQSTLEAIPRLQRRVHRAQALLEKARHSLAVAEKALELKSTKLQSLDITLAQFNPQVDPNRGVVVRAWKGRYGERGALTQFLRELLKQSAPTPLALALMVDQVELHFGIQHPEPKSRQRLRFSIRTCLRQLQARTGEIEPYRRSPGHPPGYWVYRQTSFADLQKLAGAAAGSGRAEQ